MAWSYSNWILQTTDSSRLTRLRLHIQEVSEQLGRELQTSDMATSSRELRIYLERLEKRERELTAVVGDGSTIRHARVVFDG